MGAGNIIGLPAFAYKELLRRLIRGCAFLRLVNGEVINYKSNPLGLSSSHGVKLEFRNLSWNQILNA
jgi:hypothetical protein